MLVVGVLGVLVAVVVCGVVFLVGLVRRGLVDLGLVAVVRRVSGVVGLAVGGVVLRLGVSVRALAGVVPLLSVGIGLTGAICITGAVASLPGVCGLVRVGSGRVCCMLSAMRLLVATQGIAGRSVLLGRGGRVGGAVGGVLFVAATQNIFEGSLLLGSCRRVGYAGCAVGSAASSVGGAASIRIHERVVVSAVRRAEGGVRGSRMPAGAGIASCGRMRRRGGLSRTRHTVRAVAWIRGRKSRILDIRTTVCGVAGVACGVCGVAACVCGVAGATGRIGGTADTVGSTASTVCGMARTAGDTSTARSTVCGVPQVVETFGCVLSNIRQTGHCVDANTLNLPER